MPTSLSPLVPWSSLSTESICPSACRYRSRFDEKHRLQLGSFCTNIIYQCQGISSHRAGEVQDCAVMLRALLPRRLLPRRGGVGGWSEEARTRTIWRIRCLLFFPEHRQSRGANHLFCKGHHTRPRLCLNHQTERVLVPCSPTLLQDSLGLRNLDFVRYPTQLKQRTNISRTNPPLFVFFSRLCKTTAVRISKLEFVQQHLADFSAASTRGRTNSGEREREGASGATERERSPDFGKHLLSLALFLSSPRR